jgi:hypothetical protein
VRSLFQGTATESGIKGKNKKKRGASLLLKASVIYVIKADGKKDEKPMWICFLLIQHEVYIKNQRDKGFAFKKSKGKVGRILN